MRQLWNLLTKVERPPAIVNNLCWIFPFALSDTFTSLPGVLGGSSFLVGLKGLLCTLDSGWFTQ
jgi:hypothetical protein